MNSYEGLDTRPAVVTADGIFAVLVASVGAGHDAGLTALLAVRHVGLSHRDGGFGTGLCMAVTARLDQHQPLREIAEDLATQVNLKAQGVLSE